MPSAVVWPTYPWFFSNGMGRRWPLIKHLRRSGFVDPITQSSLASSESAQKDQLLMAMDQLFEDKHFAPSSVQIFEAQRYHEPVKLSRRRGSDGMHTKRDHIIAPVVWWGRDCEDTKERKKECRLVKAPLQGTGLMRQYERCYMTCCTKTHHTPRNEHRGANSCWTQNRHPSVYMLFSLHGCGSLQRSQINALFRL